MCKDMVGTYGVVCVCGRDEEEDAALSLKTLLDR